MKQPLPVTTEASSASARQLSLKARLLRLGIALAALWLVMYVLAPLPLEYIAPMRQYARTVDRTGIIPGALYYTDVDQSIDAEFNNRDAIRFSVKKNEHAGQ